MLVANTFDLWQKDAFFTAAEEVQESTDIMESAYRTWFRERRERPSLEYLDDLRRELQAALGTAKWQLEEFERAVRLSYGDCKDDNLAARHRQFIAAIESQISCVEAGLKESFTEDGKQPLRWVNLDEEEQDDLAAFLSGNSHVSENTKDKFVEIGLPNKSPQENLIKRAVADLKSNTALDLDNFNEKKGSKDVITMDRSENYTIEIDERENPMSRDDIICQAETSNTRSIRSAPGFGVLKIVIADEVEPKNRLMAAYEDTPKEKGSKLFFWKQRYREFPQAKRAAHLFNQLFCQVCGFPRKLQNQPRLQYGCSAKLTLALMLTIFLIVPFVLYSN